MYAQAQRHQTASKQDQQPTGGRVLQKKSRSNLPTQLKTGIENLSGYSMDDVQVHYNSSKPAQLQAHAYAQGTNIYLGPGQEKHLPHEAWHVVQQKQGRVKPTMQLKGVAINDDQELEREADLLGGKALQMKSKENKSSVISNAVVEKKRYAQQGFGFVNNRPEAFSATKLQGIEDNHSQGRTQVQTNGFILQLALDPKRYSKGKKEGPRPSFPHKDPADKEAYPNPIKNVGATTKHHAIPWNKIKAFVHALIINNHPEINAIAQVASNVMINQSELFLKNNRIERMQGSSTMASVSAEIAGNTKTYNAEDQEAIATALCWFPGNLFIGPATNNRADDPGEEFESKANKALGKRFGLLKRLNANIDAFITSPKPPLNSEIMKDLKKLKRWTSPMPFSSQAWSLVDKKYSLKVK